MVFRGEGWVKNPRFLDVFCSCLMVVSWVSFWLLVVFKDGFKASFKMF